MSRITAPVSKLSRAISSSASNAQRGALFDSSSHTAGAALMPKYAELLHGRKGHEHSDSSRGLVTAHRPTPQPSIANRSKPLMQTFHSSAPTALASSTHLDAMVIPNPWELDSPTPDPGPNMPLLPDNYGAAHVADDAPEPHFGAKIVAADPEKVMPSTPMSEVDTVGLDGVELKFMYQGEPPSQAEQGQQGSGGMIRDIWKGMVDDVFGESGKKA